jgi:NDP-sugar pyrophosphorylase family protein
MERAMQCVILAGGIGSRMWPETRTTPKTLLPIAGRPFAEWQLEWLARSGIDEVIYSLGYLARDVRDFVGDGGRFGLKVSYVDEGDDRRGTAGALRLCLDEGVLDEDFLVLYGDSWLQVDPVHVLRVARQRAQPALMTVYRNLGQWDASNVIFDGELVVRYEKGLGPPPPRMCWIDYGLSAWRRQVIADRILPSVVADLAPLCHDLAAAGELAGYEVADRFYEIGSAQGRDELVRHLTENPPW